MHWLADLVRKPRQMLRDKLPGIMVAFVVAMLLTSKLAGTLNENHEIHRQPC